MIKLKIIFAVLIFITFGKQVDIASANSFNLNYAKVMADCKLYLSIDNNAECLFVIPETYFVLIIDDSHENFYKVQYKNYIGFIDKEKAQPCSFVPKIKFLDGVKFDVKETSGTQVWKSPTDKSKVLANIPAGTKNVVYVASVYGDIPLGGYSNLWFYVIYTPSEFSTNVYEGYVYSENTTNLSPIPENQEYGELQNKTENNIVNYFSNATIRTIIVTIIAIPIILLFAIILYKLVKKYQKNTNKALNLNNDVVVNEFEKMPIKDNELKNEIKKYQASEFVKKKKIKNTKNETYPVFPSYETDDDWL